MSFGIDLIDDNGDVVTVKNHEEGGTYVLGGTDEASLNITYNYSWFYYRFLNEEKGLRWLNGMKAKDCIEALGSAVDALGANRYKDYWAPTPGNAGYALNILLTWALQHKEATFVVV